MHKQYYTAVVQDEDGRHRKCYEGEELELMKTSWIHNSFISTVAMQLDGTQTVAWFGDCACSCALLSHNEWKDKKSSEYTDFIPNSFVFHGTRYLADPITSVRASGNVRYFEDNNVKLIGKTYQSLKTRHVNKSGLFVPDDLMKHGYLINHTNDEYVDLEKYIQIQMSRPDWYGAWIINPLPILTAFGNGFGENDYYGPCQEYVGRWAFDVIEFCQTFPQAVRNKGYHDITDKIMFRVS